MFVNLEASVSLSSKLAAPRAERSFVSLLSPFYLGLSCRSSASRFTNPFARLLFLIWQHRPNLACTSSMNRSWMLASIWNCFVSTTSSPAHRQLESASGIINARAVPAHERDGCFAGEREGQVLDYRFSCIVSSISSIQATVVVALQNTLFHSFISILFLLFHLSGFKRSICCRFKRAPVLRTAFSTFFFLLPS